MKSLFLTLVGGTPPKGVKLKICGKPSERACTAKIISKYFMQLILLSVIYRH